MVFPGDHKREGKGTTYTTALTTITTFNARAVERTNYKIDKVHRSTNDMPRAMNYHPTGWLILAMSPIEQNA